MEHGSNNFRRKGGAEDKIETMKSAGITISKSPADIGKTLSKTKWLIFNNLC